MKPLGDCVHLQCKKLQHNFFSLSILNTCISFQSQSLNGL